MEVIGESVKVPVTIIRGGTSKGIFIKKEFLPSDTTLRDKLILGIFGSPNKRQIDRLGGADPLTSKLAIILSSSIKGVDEVIGNSVKKEEFFEKEKRIRIGHPSGVMEVKINLRKQKNN